MFLYRVKVEEREAARMIALKGDVECSETALRSHCPIREMSVVAQATELDIYLALDDVIETLQLHRLVTALNALLEGRSAVRRTVSSELIHI
ncbi:MAG: hypothetical protein WDM91_07405 [Rhizomicrobium sp.]